MMKEAKGIVKNLENISKLKYVMSLDDDIKDVFDIIDRCRAYLSDKEIREVEKRSLLFAEEIIEKRKEIVSDPCFSDIRETFAMHEETCMGLIKLYREEIALYE